MVEVRRGKIVSVDWQPYSTMLTLVVEDSDTNKIHRLSAEASPTLRSLNQAFGGVKEAIGKEIFWWEGEWTDIGGFYPVEMAFEEAPEIVKAYEATVKKKLKGVI